MDVVFGSRDLERLESDPSCDLGLPPDAVATFRKRLLGLRSAVDTRDVFALVSWRATRTRGSRTRGVSLPLSPSARLVLEVAMSAGAEHVRVLRIEGAT